MKYEVQEELYQIVKNNGEVFKINRIKWKNTSKYDLRIWQDDTPMQGITLSATELRLMCKDILVNQGVEAVPEIDEDDFCVSTTMDSIDLYSVLHEYPDCTKTSNKLRAILKDYFPEKKREVNILCSLYDAGIAKIISKSKLVDVAEIQRFLNIAENLYGLKKMYVLWAIQTWADAYRIPCNTSRFEKIFRVGPKSTAEKPNIVNSPVIRKENVYCVGDDLVNDGDIQITYKGLRFPYSWFQFNFTLYVKNHTKSRVEVYVRGVEINDFRIRTSRYIVLDPGKQTINSDIYTNSDDLKMLGIKALSDIKKLRIDLVYEVDRKTKKKEIFLEPKRG